MKGDLCSYLCFSRGSKGKWQWWVRGNDEKKEKELSFNERVEGRRWELSLRLKEKDWVCVWKRRPLWKGNAEHHEVEHCERERPEYRVIMYYVLLLLFFLLTWKIVKTSKVLVIYIYIYIDDNMICFNYYFCGARRF